MMPGPSSVSVASLRFKSLLSKPTRVARLGAGDWPQFGAMTADRRQLQGSKDQVDIGELAAAHQRQGAAGQLLQPAERVAQHRRDPDLLRRRRDIEDGAVDVEQDRAFAQIGGKRGCGNFHVENWSF